jgi:hypothetical protein
LRSLLCFAAVGDDFRPMHLEAQTGALEPKTKGVGVMTRNQYIVVFHDGEWKIEHDGELSARYRTQEEALLDALNAARRLDRKGQEAEVLTQGADFGLRTEWTNRLERLRARVGQGSETQLSLRK